MCKEQANTISVRLISILIDNLCKKGPVAVGQSCLMRENNTLTQSLFALATSDTAFEVGANLLNLGTRSIDQLGNVIRGARNEAGRIQTDQLADGLSDALTDGLNPSDFLNPLSGIDSFGEFASGIRVGISSQSTRNQYSESITSGVFAGNNLNITAGGNITLSGGTQVEVGNNANINAVGSVLLEAAVNRSNNSSEGFGLTLGTNSLGFSVNDSNSSATTFTPASLVVGGDLTLNAGTDITLRGGSIQAGSAVVDAGRDVLIESLQDVAMMESNSFGLTVSSTGGSFNFSDANSDSQRTNAVASIITNGGLEVTVGDTTRIVGGAIGSESGDFSLTTENLVLEDLIERERAHSVGFNASVGEGELTGVGGSFSISVLDGTTEATIGEGVITVGNETAEETDARLEEVNRDLDNLTTITEDSSFDTGDVFIDVEALLDAPDNIEALSEAVDAVRANNNTLNFLNNLNAQAANLPTSLNFADLEMRLPEHLRGLVTGNPSLILNDLSPEDRAALTEIFTEDSLTRLNFYQNSFNELQALLNGTETLHNEAALQNERDIFASEILVELAILRGFALGNDIRLFADGTQISLPVDGSSDFGFHRDRFGNTSLGLLDGETLNNFSSLNTSGGALFPENIEGQQFVFDFYQAQGEGYSNAAVASVDFTLEVLAWAADGLANQDFDFEGRVSVLDPLIFEGGELEDIRNAAQLSAELGTAAWTAPQFVRSIATNPRVLSFLGLSSDEAFDIASTARRELEDAATQAADAAGTANAAELAAAARPHWRESELFVLQERGGSEQISYFNRMEVRHGFPGSTRPDVVAGNNATEVKNYDLLRDGGESSLIRDVSNQINYRAEHLPPSFTQDIVIDIRGQSVTMEQVDRITTAIVNRTNGNLTSDDIEFLGVLSDGRG